MFINFILMLIAVTYSAAQLLTDQTPDYSLCPTDNNTVITYTLDEETVKDLKKEIGLLNASNEMLRLRLELMTGRLDHQTDSFNKLTALLSTDSNLRNGNVDVPIFDVRNGFIHEPTNSAKNCTEKRKFPSNCAEATAFKRQSGIYTIQVDTFNEKPFLVVCDDETQGGGWTVIQRRMDGSIDFFRDWASYQTGFGNLEGEFFIGLNKLYALTTENGPQELLIVMSDFEGATKYAKYTSFAIGDETESYALKVLGKYSGNANDSLAFHIGCKFTTKDKQNDINGNGNCAEIFKGAWWYKGCHASNLNGLYLKGTYGKDKYAQGVVWFNWHGHYYSLKDVKMMIRPQRA